MTLDNSKICRHQDCTTSASFGFLGKKAEYCAQHALSSMTRIYLQTCSYQGCGITANYGLEGDKKATYCSQHALEKMVNIFSRKCSHKGCSISPNYALPTDKVPKFCKSHASSDMINITAVRCFHIDCDKVASFGFVGDNKPTFCKDHSSSQMEDIRSTRCHHPDCKRQAKFNFIEKRPAEFCSLHKEASMINLRTKQCVHLNCSSKPSYGYPGYESTLCAKHKQIGTIRNSRRHCMGDQKEECKEFATYGPDRTTPLHCENHSISGEICLVERECVRCKRTDVLNKAGLCVNYCSLEEDDRVFKKRIKQKEEAIGRLLQKEIPQELYSADKIIDSSCSKRRPDFVYHCGTHVVIIEVDENQHQGYLCTAYGDDPQGKMKGETIRMYEVAQCFDGLPVLFLRYNPDSYKGKKKASLSERQDTLIRWVRYSLQHQPWMEGFKVKFLFYDGYEPDNTEWEEIQPIF